MEPDDPSFDAVMAVHALSGSIALLAAPIAMAVRKGGRWHRLWGKIFVYTMMLVCATALIAGVARPNIVMALVAIFSFHLVASGWRALYLKRLHKGQRPTRLDWILHGTAGTINFCLLLYGISGLLLKQDRHPMYNVFVVFGALGSFMVVRYVYQFYKRKHERHEWLFDHVVGMLAGYIATVSAFSAVNFPHWFPHAPTWLLWLWPTLIGVPCIILTTRYYRRRYKNNRSPHNDFKVKLGLGGSLR
ncbi:MAG: hypothetical protein WAU70_01810 [Flavobacteriales bacterium]